MPRQRATPTAARRRPDCPICMPAAYLTPEARMRAYVDALRADIGRFEAQIASYEAAIALWQQYRLEHEET